MFGIFDPRLMGMPQRGFRPRGGVLPDMQDSDVPSVDSLFGRDSSMDLPMGGGVYPGQRYPAPPPAPQPQSRGGGFLDSLLGSRGEPNLGLMALGAQIGGDRDAFTRFAPAMAEQRRTNMTKKWLMDRGLSAEEADIYSANPSLLKEAFEGKKRNLINAGDGMLYDSDTDEWISSPNAGKGKDKLPTSYQEFQLAKEDGYKGTYADWINTGKGRDSMLMAGDRQAIRDATTAAVSAKNTIDILESVINPPKGSVGSVPSLNERAGYGVTAESQSWLARNDPTGFFDDAQGEATTELSNVVLGQALASLKSIFGAAPTEGERKILVDLQASVDKTPAERKIIIQRAIELAKVRMNDNLAMAEDIKSGALYRPGGVDAGTIPPPGQVPDGVDPADWEAMTDEERALWSQ